MKYAIVFGLLAILLGRASVDSASVGAWWASAAEAYLAAGFGALAIAYGLKHAGWPVERAVSSAPARAVLFPYKAVAGLALSATRRLGREPARSEIAPGLSIGRLPTRSEREGMADAGIGAILNLCAEFPPRRRPEPSPVEGFVPILDGSPPTDRQYREALAWIEARRAEGLTILIHCAQGHGRSAIVAASALCRLGLAPDLDGAIDLIRTARPGARPSKAQRASARRFLESFRDAGSK